MGTGAGYVCVQLQGSLANMKLKWGVSPPQGSVSHTGKPRGPGGFAPEGSWENRRKFKTLQPAWAAGLVPGQARPVLLTPRLRSPKPGPRCFGRGSEVRW